MERRAKVHKQELKMFLLFFLFVPLTAYAGQIFLPDQVANNPLQQPVTVETKQENFMGKLSGFTQSFKSNGGYLDFGLRTAYIFGQNSYDYNHHTSELEFPFRAYLGGGNISLGYKDLSINSEAWGSLLDDPSAGWHTKDKDWHSNGYIYSDTKSYSDMNAVIWDLNLRYNFLKYSFGTKKTDKETKSPTNMKLGLLFGYRYERFGYKDFGLYQTGADDSSYGDGQLVSEYKVKYRVPYYGLAMDIDNGKFGVLMNAKYAFKAHAKDYDNHLLRDLHFYGDYKNNPNVFMANCAVFWRFYKNWQVNFGADATLIRIDGKTWEETTPNDIEDQSIDTKQFIYWVGLGYRF